MDIKIDTSQLKIDEAIAKLPSIAEKAVEQACLIIEADAKVRCPVDTGTLRRSITHQTSGNEGVVKSNEGYAPYVEIGTGRYSSQGGGRSTPWTYQTASGEFYVTSGQKPQPFLKPAAESNRGKITSKVAEVYKNA